MFFIAYIIRTGVFCSAGRWVVEFALELMNSIVLFGSQITISFLKMKSVSIFLRLVKNVAVKNNSDLTSKKL